MPRKAKVDHITITLGASAKRAAPKRATPKPKAPKREPMPKVLHGLHRLRDVKEDCIIVEVPGLTWTQQCRVVQAVQGMIAAFSVFRRD